MSVIVLIMLLVLVTGVLSCILGALPSLSNTFFFFFMESKYIDKSAKDAYDQGEPVTNLVNSIPVNTIYEPKKLNNFRVDYSAKTKEIKSHLSTAFIVVFSTLIISLLSAIVYFEHFPLSEIFINTLQIISVFLILLALMSRLGGTIRTFGGKTLPEQLDNFLFLLLNTIAAFFIFFTYFYKSINLLFS